MGICAGFENLVWFSAKGQDPVGWIQSKNESLTLKFKVSPEDSKFYKEVEDAQKLADD